MGGLSVQKLGVSLTNKAFARLMLIGVMAACSLSAQDSTTFIYEARQMYQNVADDLLKSAEKMPAGFYQFQPTRESPTFADWINEAMASQADICSAIDSKRVQLQLLPQDKAHMVEMLRDSIRNCSAAYDRVNNFTASQEVVFGGKRRSKLGLLYMNVSHDYEVYGQMSVYLRLKGLTPPSVQAKMLPIGDATR